MSHSQPFSPELRATILSMIADGKPGSAIAESIGRSLGSVMGFLRRNPDIRAARPPRPAISAEANRTKNVRGGKPAKVQARPKQDFAVNRATASKFQDRSQPAPNSLMVSLLDLQPGDCKYPIGDPRHEGFGFCGAEAGHGSYCQHHRALVYVSPEKRAA